MDAGQLLNGLAYGALLTLLASGLALIYGLRNVMNFGHGALYLLGAYLGFSVGSRTSFWLALVVVPALLALVGLVLELTVLRPLRDRPVLDVALVTFGIALVIDQIVLELYGGTFRSVPAPGVLDRTVNLAGTTFPAYRLFLIAVGVLVCSALFGWLHRTRSGLHVRAVSQQPATAAMMGVDSDRVGAAVVCLGSALAGLAGVLAGPFLALSPAMGSQILISSLLVVVIGGLGSIGGAVLAAGLYGLVQVLGTELVPDVAVAMPYVLLVVVLLLRPQGIGRGREA